MSEIRLFIPRVKIVQPQNQEAQRQEIQHNFAQQTNNYYDNYNIAEINNNKNIIQQNNKNMGNKVYLKSEVLCKLKKKIRQQKAEEIEKEREIKMVKEEQEVKRKAKEEQEAQKAKVKQTLNIVLSKLEVSNQDEASETVSHSDDFILNNNLLQNALKSFNAIEKRTQQHASIQTIHSDNLSNIQKLKPRAEKIREQEQKYQEQQNYGALNSDIIFIEEIENDVISIKDESSIIDELSSSNGYALSFGDL